MKKAKVKNAFLDELRKVPIIQVACEKIGISRTSVYRWRESDEEFTAAMDQALAEGEALVNDMSESQLLVLVKEKNYSAISFWLRHRNPKFKEKIEITTKTENLDQLTPEQEATVRQALELGRGKTEISNINNQDENKHE